MTSVNKITTGNGQLPRARQACVTCRRQKTRCFPSPNSVSCLRCLSLAKECSFLTDGTPFKLDQDTVNRKRKLDDEMESAQPTMEGSETFKALQDNVKRILSIVQRQHGIQSSTNFDDMDASSKPLPPAQTCPFNLISKSVSYQSTPITISHLLSPTPPFTVSEPPNVLSLGIVTYDEAIYHVNKFKECYGRWISLPPVSAEKIIDSIKNSAPMLLTTICLTSMRYQVTGVNYDTYQHLIRQLRVELFEGLYKSPQSLNFLKALVILAVYGYSITTPDFVVDPWFLSGVAVKHFLTIDMTNDFLSANTTVSGGTFDIETEKLSNYRIWNHMCLVHLCNCVFSGRMCVLDEIRLDQARHSLDLSQATNFDGRMISEISLQLLLYNYIQAGSATDFEVFEEDLKLWYDQWNYLFKQPNLQFVEFGYHYVYVVAFYHLKLGAVNILDDDTRDVTQKQIDDPDILNKMLYHCLKVLNHIIGLNDDLYFKCLSDQIHICTFYISIVFLKVIVWCKLYNTTYDTHELLNFVKKVETIKKKFEVMSSLSDDLPYRLAQGLHEMIDQVVPEIQAHNHV
ncbi:CYFA0S16e02278g1_1 [Cyberlindnera fabianii]|uniref:CYFA0S16e02278g1_1 n=1 Tax=Cyberlindnera fabianii TaxID=36022 RepID=A0A061BB63_CYBFA|nr:CYFA0S16e02278g1_1 [Cyberlindnera fabianii]